MRLHNRQVKADFWRDTELIRALPPAGRMFYQGLWHLSDDSGCIEDDPYAYKMHLFALDEEVTVELISQWRDILINLGKLIRYEAAGKQCLYLKNFHKHQKLDKPSPPNEYSVPLPPWIEWHQGDTRRDSRYIVRDISETGPKQNDDIVPDVSRTCPGQEEDKAGTCRGLEPKNLEPYSGLLLRNNHASRVSDLPELTNQKLIAELVDKYRAIPGTEPMDGDYPFMGQLYNKHGYDEVLVAIDRLEAAMQKQKIKKPLVYLAGILNKKGRHPPRSDDTSFVSKLPSAKDLFGGKQDEIS